MNKNDKYLVVNAGSSSFKFSLYGMPGAEEIVNGCVERIGMEDSFYTLKFNGQKVKKSKMIFNHVGAVETMVDELLEQHFISDISDIKGIGHRVLHGGEIYSDSVIIDDEVLNNIRTFTKLGPLHHPGQINGIESMKFFFPGVPQVATFDTAFHQTIPEENYMYAVPYDFYKENDVRKYGFHGTSHKYITQTMQKYLGKENVNLIVCHIGSGASIACIKDGKSFDTTMGLTPLDGLVMGTRCGQIDSSIIEYICKERNLSVEEVMSTLNKESGLSGICGKSDFRDVRALAAQGDHNAQLAIEMYKNAIVKFIAQYYFELRGNVDAIVFTAGVGENEMSLRENVIGAISDCIDTRLDKESNDNIASYKDVQFGQISTPDSKVKIMVIPTDEERMILEDTYRLCEKEKTDSHKYSK